MERSGFGPETSRRRARDRQVEVFGRVVVATPRGQIILSGHSGDPVLMFNRIGTLVYAWRMWRRRFYGYFRLPESLVITIAWRNRILARVSGNGRLTLTPWQFIRRRLVLPLDA